MAAKRRLKRKEIKEDQLVTFALRVSSFVQDHFTQVVTGVVVLVAVIGIALFTAQARRNTSRGAERELSIAIGLYQAGDNELATSGFTNVADRYASHHAGVTASYFLGRCRFEQYQYPEAIQAFDRYLSKAGKTAPFRSAALMGKALSHEGLGEFAEAARILDELSRAMDPKDARYMDVLFRAGSAYERAGQREKAATFFERVAKEATGPIKGRADVRLSFLR